MTVTIRPLDRRDLDAVAAIEGVVNPYPWSRQLFEGELALPPSSRHWLVAISARSPARAGGSGSAVIGFGGIMLAGDTAHIMNLGVDPAHTRAGIGQWLCVELVSEARRRGAVDLTLEVRASNAAAIALYEKLDMVATGHRPRYYPDGEDAVIYWIHDLEAAAVDDRLRELQAP
ncbi:MAG: ribosomal protein S18-alanine N-acetyltransferase [Actinomycetia bacterium]|nr:ribosomal protein S18-alanine N-acetyltransferase [Actinomycetes bacterium]